jgi:hypothetical protein
MPLPLNHPVDETVVHAHSPNVGATAVQAGTAGKLTTTEMA